MCWSSTSPLSALSISAGHCPHVLGTVHMCWSLSLCAGYSPMGYSLSLCAGHCPRVLGTVHMCWSCPPCPLRSLVSSPHTLPCAVTLREPLASPCPLAFGSGWLCRGLHCGGSWGGGAERLPELSPASGPRSARSCLNQASECWGSCFHGPPLSRPCPQA